MVHAADDILKFKYIVKNTAEQWGKTATFMPKPLFGDNGSGMHTHQSLWNGSTPLFYDEKGYGGLSDIARWYIGGILAHAPSVLAFTNPTLNSYHRLVKGYEAPVNLVYSAGNRSAAIRIPITGTNPKAKRIEFRAPDASGNPYLAFAAQLMAGLDGIKNRIEPHEPVDKDLYELPPEEAKNIPQVPNSLQDSLDALAADHEFLLAGGVFTPELIETWIEYKIENEIKPLAARPHPFEYELYYGVLSQFQHEEGPRDDRGPSSVDRSDAGVGRRRVTVAASMAACGRSAEAAARRLGGPPCRQRSETIGDETPLRFSIILADPGQADRGPRGSRRAPGDGADRPGRRAACCMWPSAFQPGSAAVLRPLNVLDRAGIAVAGLELSGLVTRDHRRGAAQSRPRLGHQRQHRAVSAPSRAAGRTALLDRASPRRTRRSALEIRMRRRGGSP